MKCIIRSENDSKAFSQNLVQLIALRDDDKQPAPTPPYQPYPPTASSLPPPTLSPPRRSLSLLPTHPPPPKSADPPIPIASTQYAPNHIIKTPLVTKPPRKEKLFEHPSQAEQRINMVSWLYMKIRDRKPTFLIGLNHLSSCSPTLVVLSFRPSHSRQ